MWPNSEIRITEDLKTQFESDWPVEIDLKPFNEICLNYGMSTEMGPSSNITTIYIFASISLLIIIIACINYRNLATARSIERAKEVGVRKVMVPYFLRRSNLYVAMVNSLLFEKINERFLRKNMCGFWKFSMYNQCILMMVL